jgi:hypothetical protein
MNEIPIKESITASIIDFLDSFANFSKQLQKQRIVFFKAKTDGLLNGFNSLKNIINTFNEKEAVHYNIFEILNIRKAEVKTHTPFLTNLLKPNGSHGQKNLFLSSFIENFIPKEKRDNFILSDIEDYQIDAEKIIYSGIIDISIQSLSIRKKFGIIIENKLNAGDQEKQLFRYYKYLKERNYNENQTMIFYLTIEGNDPSSTSINDTLKNELKNKSILINLSYKNDIRSWLQNIIKDIKSDKVRYQIEQYLQIIKRF